MSKEVRLPQACRFVGRGYGWVYSRLLSGELEGRQVGGFDLTPDELPLFLASVRAMATYASVVRPERGHLRGDRAA